MTTRQEDGVADGDAMEICMLQFDGSDSAKRALDSALERHGFKAAWLHEVAVLRRSRRGRVETRAPYRRKPTNGVRAVTLEPSTVRESAAHVDLDAELVCRERTTTPSLNGRVVQLERDVFKIVELEELLEPNSSALLLIAAASACDDMEATFAGKSRRTCRQDVLEDIDTTLRQLLETSRAAATNTIDAGGP